eukprot:6207645-Pleurochrysis_carterae.AAC.5
MSYAGLWYMCHQFYDGRVYFKAEVWSVMEIRRARPRALWKDASLWAAAMCSRVLANDRADVRAPSDSRSA